MTKKENVHAFAVYWLEKFYLKKIDERQDISEFCYQCDKLKFELNNERHFEVFSNGALKKEAELRKVIHDVNDQHILGSIILSKWRYLTHWTGDSLLTQENRGWFIVALSRLAVISSGEQEISRTISMDGVLRAIQQILTLVDKYNPYAREQAKKSLMELCRQIKVAEECSNEVLHLCLKAYTKADELIVRRVEFARVAHDHKGNMDKREKLKKFLMI